MKPTPYMHVHFATFIRTTGNLVKGSWRMSACFVSFYIIVQLPIFENFTVDGTCLSQKDRYNTTPAARTIASLWSIGLFYKHVTYWNAYPEWIRQCYAMGKSVHTRQGSIHMPLLKIPVDHFVIDELHVLLQLFDD